MNIEHEPHFLCRWGQETLLLDGNVYFFPPNSSASFLGKKPSEEISWDTDTLRSSVIPVLESYISKNGKPADWPDFSPIKDAKEEIKMNSRTINKYFLVIENENSTTGREVQLDAVSVSTYYVRRKIDNKVVEPRLYLLSSSRAPDIFLKESNSHSTLTSIMMKMSGTEKRSQLSEEEIKEAEKPLNSHQVNDEAVHAADLLQGLRYSFYNEIGLKKFIKDKSLIALKNFIHQLYLHLDIDSDLTSSLSQLDDWIETKLDENLITHNEWRDKIQIIFYNILPTSTEFVGCAGSKSHLRGYPCSLWTLFHVMTVHSSYMSKLAKNDPPKVLMAMKGYVKYFFGCTECCKNFLKMAKNVEDDVRGDQEALWLWRSHNRVNKRLKGTPSEDPTHVKLQFPSRILCWSCQKRSNQFRVSNVVEYLKKRYAKAHIIMDHPKRKLFIHNSKSVLFLSQFDVGFCIVFYIASVFLIVCVYIYFWRKRACCRKVLPKRKYLSQP
ncbi:DgyrCDS7938 [Dimorphilus gyrociliatus]|uniref:Sulfhydryl oxidase n=1 Tax=Dimorphilus gyrociliatus TaxID=2664684 RepID=A0A7I8VSM9_9ANNE|nr:DgyrCDS7938 [Dimorphilus gyrociliatus]